MALTLVGVSHRTAPVEIRERLAYRPGECADAVTELCRDSGAEGGILLSTCNRTEVCLVTGDTDVAPVVVRALSARLGADASPHVYVRRDRDVVAHVFAVAAGLDSMVFGEAQIQGQVREALENCRGVAGPVLSRLFHAAGTTASRVRAETGVARGAGSVSSAAVALAKKIFGPLAGRKAMVLGAGEVAELAIECLAAEGVRTTVVANRTHARAAELASRFGARAAHYDECWASLAAVDVLICSTASPHPIVHREHVQPALRDRAGSPLCILDIALPRDVAADVAKLDGVFLYDLDDLHAAAASTLERRREDLPRAEAIIASEAERYWQWLAGLQAVPVLSGVRDHVERLRRSEVATAAERLGPLSDDQRELLERFSKSLMTKFLHEPSVRLREAATNGRGLGVLDAARYLFGVDPDEPRRAPGVRSEAPSTTQSPE